MLEQEQTQNPAPLPIPRDKRGRIRWSILRQDPALLNAVIETEARSAITFGIRPSHMGLTKAGLSYLSAAIQSYYPDRFTGLRRALDLPTVKPKNYWAGPEMLEKMKDEARLVYQQEGTVSQGLLNKTKRSDLVNAVRKHYPGGLRQLKKDIGVAQKGKPKGYWTPDIIRREAEEFWRQHGDLSQTLMRQAGRSDLAATVRKKYSGGLNALKRELGVNIQRKPHGYWTVENVTAESMQIYTQFGVLTPRELIKHDRGDLLHAIVGQYPGGISQLKLDLGMESERRQAGFWTPEKIREEALTFSRQYGGITYALLGQGKRYDLCNAIAKHYPGKIRQLQKDLDTQSNKKPNGYWTPENIELEAANFFREYSVLTFASLRRHKQHALSNSIRKKYPGSMVGLKEKLEIKNEQEVSISSEEANEQLKRLLEDQI